MLGIDNKLFSKMYDSKSKSKLASDVHQYSTWLTANREMVDELYTVVSKTSNYEVDYQIFCKHTYESAIRGWGTFGRR